MTAKGAPPTAPRAVLGIIRALERKGFETWAVGGAVRDALAGHRPDGDDWDLATRARPEQIRAVFGRVVPIGIDHGTVGVPTRDRRNPLIEITTFRRDVETFGRRATIAFAGNIREDLARRDFTINALAWHPLRRELLDPFGGIPDLAAGVLRTVGDARTRITEDFLRILRGLRFAGRFSLTIEPGAWTALCEYRRHLRSLSPERVREELTKVLGDARPSRTLSLYGALGVLPVLYPELQRCLEWREDGMDVWSRGLLMADRVSARYPAARLACLLHGIGLPIEGSARDRPPEERGRFRTVVLMERLRYSKAHIAEVSALVEAASAPPSPNAAGAELRRWLSRTLGVRRLDLFRMWIARARLDAACRTAAPGVEVRLSSLWNAVRRELAGCPPLAVGDLAIGGKDLIAMGMRPGPCFSEVLAHLLELVLEDPTLNRPSVLRERVQGYITRRKPRVPQTGTAFGTEMRSVKPGAPQ